MEEKNEGKVPACLCNSGFYCRKHKRYSSKVSSLVEYQREHLEPSDCQRCGGGKRIIRKDISRQD